MEINELPNQILSIPDVVRLIDESLEKKPRDRRSYIGASSIGKPCAKQIRYELSDIEPSKNFSGRILRIFEMGNSIEEMMYGWLTSAGFDIIRTNDSGEQLGFIELDGKFCGHVDGIVVGVPEILRSIIKTPAVHECKSMNAGKFAAFKKNGLDKSHPEYAVQIALYQAYMERLFPGISENPALLTVFNKNTAEIEAQLVPFNLELAQKASDRALILVKQLDQDAREICRISKDQDHFVCRYCNYKKQCWEIDT